MLQEHLPVGIVSAIAGGIIGAVYASAQDRDTLGRTFFETLIASVAAAAVAEKLLPLHLVWQCAIAGVGTGLVTGYVLDSIRALAPATVQRILEKLAGKIDDSL